MINNELYCGLECEFSNIYDVVDFLKFNGLDLGERYFLVVDDFVCLDGQYTTMPQKLTICEYKQFLEKPVYFESLVLHLYSTDTDSELINTYEEYLRSGCEMIVLLYDSGNLEIYCKDREWLDVLYSTAKNMAGVLVKRKYEDTDRRTRMYV